MKKQDNRASVILSATAVALAAAAFVLVAATKWWPGSAAPAAGMAMGQAASTMAGGTPTGAGPEGERVRVERRTVSDDIEVAGHLKPRAEQEIRAPADGIVEEVLVREGERVGEGQAIARLDSTAARYEVERLQYEVDQQAFAGNKRKVELLKGELAVRQRAVDDLTIRAHLDGTVSRLSLRPGDVLKSGESYGRVVDVRSLMADVEIPELDIPRARPGIPVEFRFPAFPGLVAKGRLASFPAEARVNEQRLTVLDARLIIDEPPRGLLPAYSFNAVIRAGPPRDVLVIDARALSYEGGRPSVHRVRPDGSTERVEIETEGFGGGLVRVVKGLAEGEELLVPGPADGAGGSVTMAAGAAS